MGELLGVLRLPSPSALALFVATVIAEVPVIIARMVLTVAVLLLVLLIKGEPLGGAGGLLRSR
jgi:hypothetical protein